MSSNASSSSSLVSAGRSSSRDVLESTRQALDDLPPSAIAGLSAAGATALTLSLSIGYKRYWRRIRNADSVTTSMLDSRRWVRGVVTSVGDGGTKRMLAEPGSLIDLRQLSIVPYTRHLLLPPFQAEIDPDVCQGWVKRP